MREEIQKFHTTTLQMFEAMMFEQLIYPHNIVTESSKLYQFEDKDEIELAKPLKGYFAMKEVDGKKCKYFIEEQYFQDMPLKVKEVEELLFKEGARSKSVILRPIEITPFRIKAEQIWNDQHQFIEELAPFRHTHPDQWLLSKIIALMGYVGKTFCGVCSMSEFGKSTMYLILDSLTKKCPVFQPRSVPGVLAQITCDGNMIFDEVHDAPSEVKQCMENFSLQVAGNTPVYINGAMKAKNTKPRYDVSQQSITYLYNVYGNYSNPQKQFWNNIWANKKAMESRFLCMQFEGKLLEEFDKEFDIPAVAEQNKMFYIRIAKHLLYLKQLKVSNGYARRFKPESTIMLGGRHQIIYDEITWGIDIYSRNNEEYQKLVNVLNQNIQNYNSMSSTTMTEHKEEELVIEEEMIAPMTKPKSDPERVKEYLSEHKEAYVEQLIEDLKVSEETLKKMISRGDIYEIRSGMVSLL